MPQRVVNIADVPVGAGAPLAVVAGPCVIESADLCLRVAEAMKTLCDAAGVGYVFKASFDKANRTALASFRGPGLDEGLAILARVRDEAGTPVLSDVHLADQCPAAGQALDALQIPAFLCRQTDLIVAAAETGKPLNIKKAQFMAPGDMANVCAKARESGNDRLILTERGTFFGYRRLVSDMTSIPRMQALGAPVLFDATHSVQTPGGEGHRSGGDRDMVGPLACAAVAAGADGLFLEVHPEPEKGLSDAASMLPLSDAAALVEKAVRIHEALRARD